MTWSTRFALAFIPLAIAGCDDNACTEIAVASVTLEVVDAENEDPLPDAQITFSVDGGESRTPADGFDGIYGLAYEEEGTFDVTVTSEGFEQIERSYEVVMDDEGCHVEGVSDTIALAREE